MNVQLRSHGVATSDDLRRHVERRLRFALGRFEDRVDRIRVRLSDENGPRGGDDDILCLVEAGMGSAGTLRIEQRDRDPFAAVARASRRVGQEAARKLGRLRSRRRRR